MLDAWFGESAHLLPASLCHSSFVTCHRSLFRFRGEVVVDDDGDGAVAGDVAGGAEAVHGDVQGYHKGLLRRAEAQNRT